VAGLVSARAGASEITSTWSGNSGDWTDGTQWSTNPNYPNNGTPSGVSYDALINAPGAGAYTVSLSTSITTDSVTLSSPNATLSQTGGTLTTTSLNISAGTYSLSGGAANFTSYNNTGGIYSVTDADSSEFLPGSTDFNNTGGAIESGVNSSILFNLSGTVTTAQLGNLVVNGGRIAFDGNETGLIDNLGQTLTFGGTNGTVHIEEAAIDDGGIDFPATVSLGHVTLIDVTLCSDITATDTLIIEGVNAAGHTLNIIGPSTSLAVEPNNPSDSSATLSNVKINLGGGQNANGDCYVFSVAMPLTVDPTTVINGSGGVGFMPGGPADPTLTNQGIITANLGGQPLQIATTASTGAALTNTGTLQAVSGGILNIDPVLSNSGFPRMWTNNGILAIDDISAINIDQGLTFATGSALNMTLGNNGNSGLLNIAGGVSFQTGADLNLTLEAGGIFSGPYEIATYTGGLSGVFSQVTPGFVVDYSHSGEILVTAIPEPTGFGLLFVGAGLVLTRRRKNDC
jgi:hypothetical protein